MVRGENSYLLGGLGVFIAKIGWERGVVGGWEKGGGGYRFFFNLRRSNPLAPDGGWGEGGFSDNIR